MVFFHCDIVHGGEEDTTANTSLLLRKRSFLSTTKEGVGTTSTTTTTIKQRNTRQNDKYEQQQQQQAEGDEQGHDDWLGTEREGNNYLFRYLQDISDSMPSSSPPPGPLPSTTPPTVSPSTSVPSSPKPTAAGTLSPPSSAPLSSPPTVEGCIDPTNCNNALTFPVCSLNGVDRCCVDPNNEDVLETCSTDADCCGEESFCNMEGPNVCCSAGGSGCYYVNNRDPECLNNPSMTVKYQLSRRTPPVTLRCRDITTNTRICTYVDLIQNIPIEQICQSQCNYGCS